MTFDPISPDDRPADHDRRRAPRLPLPGVLVTLVSPDGERALFASDALDISAAGLALVLPEGLNGCVVPGDGVLLSFRLDESTTFARMPGRLVRREEGVAAVEFGSWEGAARSRLADWLAAGEAA
jgi:hypothetical protein